MAQLSGATVVAVPADVSLEHGRRGEGSDEPQSKACVTCPCEPWGSATAAYNSEERCSNVARRGPRAAWAEPARFRNSSFASALTGLGRHTVALARADVAKHRDHCMRIERASLFQAVVLLESHEGLLRLRPDHTVE